MSGYIIELQASADVSGIDMRALERLAAHALKLQMVKIPSELSILLADDATVRELNRTYRDSDSATDVLSFAQSEGDVFARPDGAAPHLGDVVISLDTARRQGEEHGVGLQDEVSHLLVHGILHLLGHDHEDADGLAAIRPLEEQILGDAHHY